jgi:uncharacterized protein with von Willebrand factor type A (vWA) domain
MVAALGGWDQLMQTLRRRLDEQRGRHQGGSKWIGTAGTSPFGAYGYNPEGMRVGQQGGRSRSAIKVWDERTFRNLDDSVEINTRNIKIALRRLRRFARQGVPDEFDLDTTIERTARNAGWLDVQLRPERRNRVKVLLFLDVGGSMDPHVQVCEELFSAAKSEFRHLEYFYFHNCVYDYVWRDNHRRRNERIATFDLLHKYGRDWKLIFVGDAAMSPYELMQPGGSVEYANEEPGAAWFAADRRVPPCDLAQPGARADLAIHALDADGAGAPRPAHVSSDPRRPAARHRGAAQIAVAGFRRGGEAPFPRSRQTSHARRAPAPPASRR